MVGRVGQFSEIPVDSPTRLLLVGGQDGLALWSWRFVREVGHRAGFGGQGDGWVGAYVLHPLRFAASGYQIPSAVEAYGDDGNMLLLLAAPLCDRESLGVADAGGHRDPVEDLDGEPRGLEVGHEVRV